MDQNILQFIKDDIREIKSDYKELSSKVDTLLQFKWQIVGGSMVASLIITVLFQIAMAVINTNKETQNGRSSESIGNESPRHR